METTNVNQDITVMYVTASSFPDGVMDAHKKLHSIVPVHEGRQYFGISRPEHSDGTIVYRAAAEQISEGEAEDLGLETLTLRSGNYIRETIKNFAVDMSSIGRTFDKLTQLPGIDPEGYCVEVYPNENDVECMIRLEKGEATR